MPYEYPWEKTATIEIMNMSATLGSFLVCISFLFPPSHPQATADKFSFLFFFFFADKFSITLDWFRFSRILHKWNQAVYSFDFSVWHLSHIIIILKLIHVVQYPMMSSSTLLGGIPLHGYTSLLICILGLLPVFIITNKWMC